VVILKEVCKKTGMEQGEIKYRRLENPAKAEEFSSEFGSVQESNRRKSLFLKYTWQGSNLQPSVP
jgi:hypothetical protein